MAHVRDRPSLRESVEITTPAGNRYRWGDDEDNAANVPSGERYTDTMPGGFAEHEAVLPRKPSVDYADLERLSTITRYDASGGIIWQGRLERAPKVSGDQIAISPSAVGWQAHLEDDKSAQMVYIDRDLNRWREPSGTRRVALAATVSIGSMSIAGNAQDAPAVILSFQGPWAQAAGMRSEAYYEAPAGVNLGGSYFNWSTNPTIGTGGSNWFFFEYASDDGLTFFDASADQLTGASSIGTLTFTPATKRRMLMAQMGFSTGPAGGDGSDFEVFLTNVAVYGDHGLTLRGTIPEEGYYDADIIGHALSRWCPLVTYTAESLTAGSFVVPHAAFVDPTTTGEIVRQTIRFDLRDWAVWEGPIFWLHDRGSRGTKWRARVAPSQLEETGPQVERIWESVIVQYQDVDQSTRTVGPVGAGTDTETDDLKDDDPDNPANKLGITRRALLTMGIGTAGSATEVGRRFLEESRLLDSSGRARLIGHVQDSHGVWHPYSHVRAGDTISFVDSNDTSYRRIVRTEKNREDRSCSIDLDAPPEGLQALLERLGVVLVSLGL